MSDSTPAPCSKATTDPQIVRMLAAILGLLVAVIFLAATVIGVLFAEHHNPSDPEPAPSTTAPADPSPSDPPEPTSDPTAPAPSDPGDGGTGNIAGGVGA
ncbi:hypothetical protein [Streptomyces niveus]|uniref:hypothetical protein n=1 Tax=Streptomyces niveus TaxID=193462 RepID=UPI003415A21D